MKKLVYDARREGKVHALPGEFDSHTGAYLCEVEPRRNGTFWVLDNEGHPFALACLGATRRFLVVED